ncbi:unnamed protein product [Cercopithifilaria johnstoni]|nr:unnamed protein product [Cercopithifilaria johnstoni]
MDTMPGRQNKYLTVDSSKAVEINAERQQAEQCSEGHFEQYTQKHKFENVALRPSSMAHDHAIPLTISPSRKHNGTDCHP